MLREGEADGMCAKRREDKHAHIPIHTRANKLDVHKKDVGAQEKRMNAEWGREGASYTVRE